MEYKTKTIWYLWFHSITNNEWGKSSYKKISNINSFFDYQYFKDIFKQDHYQNGMFFCMKDNIFPNWEDPDNREGGCLSFKVPSRDIINEWNNLLLRCINESILTKDNDEINGISISPKKEFNIIKIWFKNDSFDYKKYFQEFGEYFLISKSLYKKHEV
ncbi:MAG: hypothetical protein CL470_08475 [Acidimicrobiaceae bacterium]|nr:hypothetical protein [Acidimicrobiaceae bacterium]|tara:strand:- start:636 stop:1112 length:477 start_codon:yes stop_codon:yes gene_type:complete